MRISANNDIAEFMARSQLEEDDDFGYEEELEPEHSPDVKIDENWYPRLNPSQRLVFDEEEAERILCVGPRGSGKGMGALHKLVKHCYLTKNAFALIIGVSAFAVKDGMWNDLQTIVLPTWRDGNRKPHPKTGAPTDLIDTGIGLEYTEGKPDAQTKRLTLWIANIHGGWSKVQMVSVPNAYQIEGRMKGPKPTFIILEECTEMESQDYFTVANNQLGRATIEGVQHLIGVCNPKGPSHWVYQLWYKTHRKNKRYKHFNIPFEENRHNLPRGYIENIKDGLKNDPIKYRRDIKGEWVEYPDGSAIFKSHWNRRRHLKGDPLEGTGVPPREGYPIILGWDTGTKNTSVSFLQRIPVKNNKVIWINFDEYVHIGEFKTIPQYLPIIMDKLNFWCKRQNTKFFVENISDKAAFDIIQSDGSYDSVEIERISEELLRTGKYPYLDHLNTFIMEPAPKGQGSKEARVKMMIQLLVGNEFIVSGTCHKHLQMFENLRCEDETRGGYKATLPFMPKKTKSGEIHTFDSVSYPPYFYIMGGSSVSAPNKSSFVDLR